MRQYRFVGLNAGSGGASVCLNGPEIDFFNPATVKTIYFGGFNNLNGGSLDKALIQQLKTYIGPDLFSEPDHRMFAVIEEESGGEEQVLDCVYRFNRAADTTCADQRFVETYLFPCHIVSAEISLEEKVERLQRHLSSINIMGYSAGASVVQRIQILAIRYMQSMGFSSEMITACNKGLIAHTFGPVSEPVLDMRGFTQLVHTHRQDLITAMMGPLNLRKMPAGDRPLSYLHENGNLYICSDRADLMQKSIIFRPKELLGKLQIVQRRSAYGHSPPIYLQYHAICDDNETMTFPSLAGTVPCLLFFQAAIESSLACARSATKRDGRALLDNFVRDHLSVEQIVQYGVDFDQAIAQFNTLTASDMLLETMRLCVLSQSLGDGVFSSFPGVPAGCRARILSL